MLRGVAAARRRSSLASVQGCQLPTDGSPLGMYPVKCCVLIQDLGSGTSWYMILYCIGRVGDPHLGRLRHPPDAGDWNTGMGGPRQFSDRTPVLRSCWPYRPSVPDARGVEIDPMISAELPVQGSIEIAHLSSVRSRT